jgi:hypothetical protein
LDTEEQEMISNQFERYPHLVRLDDPLVDGILVGTVEIYPKLDGTNASVWMDADGRIRAASRNRELTLEHDNFGFLAWASKSEVLQEVLRTHEGLRLYGEWLVPHTLKTYREDAWNRFWVFDAVRGGKMFPPHLLPKYPGLDVIHPLAVASSPTKDQVHACLERNTFLIKDGEGFGEGIVIKNYGWQGKTWAKVVRNEFKELNHRAFGTPTIKGNSTEQEIVETYITKYLVDKNIAKLQELPREKKIPALLSAVYREFVCEDLIEALRRFSQPTIDFRLLNRLAIAKVKELCPDLF